jgi:hypothetical protein
MKATNCKWEELQEALKEVNKKYDNNIRFNPDNNGCQRFTLRAKIKSERETNKGCSISVYSMMSRYSNFIGKKQNKRYTGSACWHVHGDFFDALFKINQDAVIWSRGLKIDKNYGNWENYNIGSILYPVYASDCCDCE